MRHVKIRVGGDVVIGDHGRSSLTVSIVHCSELFWRHPSCIRKSKCERQISMDKLHRRPASLRHCSNVTLS